MKEKILLLFTTFSLIVPVLFSCVDEQTRSLNNYRSYSNNVQNRTSQTSKPFHKNAKYDKTYNYNKLYSIYLTGNNKYIIFRTSQIIKRSPNYYKAHFLKALALTRVGNLKKANESFLQGAKICIKSKDFTNALILLSLKGINDSILGNTEYSLNKLSKFIKKRGISIYALSMACNSIGYSYYVKGMLKAAKRMFIKTIRMQGGGYATTLGMAHLGLGRCYIEQQNFQAGEYNIAAALEYLKQGGETLTIIQGHIHMGLVMLLRSNLRSALAQFNTSLRLSISVGYKRGINTSLSNIALILDKQGKNNLAIKHLKKAIKNLKKINANRDLSFAHFNLAWIYYEKGDFINAINQAKQSLTCFKNNNAKIGIGRTNFLLGLISFNKGEYGNAKEYFEKAISSPIPLIERSKSYALLGLIFSEWKNKAKTLSIIKKAIKTYRGKPEILAYCFLAYARMYSKSKQYKRAIKNYNLSKKYFNISRKKREAIAVTGEIGLFYMKRKLFNRAIPFLIQSIRNYSVLNMHFDVIVNLYNIAVCYQKMKKYTIAFRYAKIAENKTKKLNLDYPIINKLVKSLRTAR